MTDGATISTAPETIEGIDFDLEPPCVGNEFTRRPSGVGYHNIYGTGSAKWRFKYTKPCCGSRHTRLLCDGCRTGIITSNETWMCRGCKGTHGPFFELKFTLEPL